MHYFLYRGSELYCEDLPISRIAEEVKTPFYLYSHQTLTRHFRVFDEAFEDLPHLICFAVKANANLAILKLFAREGSGFDVVSGGELYRALRAGADPQKIVYAGVGKTPEEIRDALQAGILMFNVESPQELKAIEEVAASLGTQARVALRVNPDVDPQTHPYISTGLKKNKFGFDIRSALQEYRVARQLPHLEIVGIHIHIGSQIVEIAPFRDAFDRVISFIADLKREGIAIRYLDLGGGLGIPYKDEEPPTPKDLAQALSSVASSLDCTFVLEPGRVIVGNAGILVTRVLYHKSTPEKHFLIVDAGMNDLIRPSLYGSYHGIQPVIRKGDKGDSQPSSIIADVVGPICESGDFLAKDRRLPEAAPGELLAVMTAGAYGFTMSSNYNARPRVAEVLVKGSEYRVIRQRETYADLVRGEKIPEW
ncbi:MAG: diaminopimelate decarboxylase [Nitrospinae bacterium]|nr:diaminopimelate decarboxylase [Nitrospinota bacterium]